MDIIDGIVLARADREAGLRQWRVSLYRLDYGCRGGFQPAAILVGRCPLASCGRPLTRHQRGAYCPGCDLSWKVKTHREATWKRAKSMIIVYVRAGEVLP